MSPSDCPSRIPAWHLSVGGSVRNQCTNERHGRSAVIKDRRAACRVPQVIVPAISPEDIHGGRRAVWDLERGFVTESIIAGRLSPDAVGREILGAG